MSVVSIVQQNEENLRLSNCSSVSSIGNMDFEKDDRLGEEIIGVSGISMDSVENVLDDLKSNKEITINDSSKNSNRETVRLLPSENEIVNIEHTVKSSLEITNDSNSKNYCFRLCKQWKNYAGIIFVILHALMLSLVSLTMKTLHGKGYPPFLLVFAQFLIMALAMSILFLRTYFGHKKRQLQLIKCGDTSQAKTKFFIWLRAVSGSTGMIFFVYSLKYLSVADTTVIACSAPIFVYIFACLLLNEKCGVVSILMTIVAIMGVFLILRPPLITGAQEFKKDDVIGFVLAFMAMLSITFAIIILRFLQNVHHNLINFVFGVWGACQALILVLITNSFQFSLKDSYTTDILILVSGGLLTVLGMSSIALALQHEQAGPVALVKTSEILFAFVWQFLFLGVNPDIVSIVGAFMVVTGVLITVLRKWMDNLPADHFLLKYAGVLRK